MKRASILVLATLLLATGCARNAMLELDVVVPPQTVADRPFAYIEVSSDISSFDESPFSIQGTANLDVMDGGTAPFAVLTGDESTEVRVRVRYCRSASCSDIDDVRAFEEGTEPGLFYSFERAFYIGAVTSYTLEVGPLSAEQPLAMTSVSTICRCQVAGCATTLPGGSYCRGTSDVCDSDPTHTHFCE